jgi:V8-like Glu-specific endopeptidase
MKTEKTVTGDDGTKYELQGDGTLRELESCRQPPIITTCNRSEDRPMKWSEQSDRTQAVEATKEVPEELRRLWSDLSDNHCAAVQRIKRDVNDRQIPTERQISTLGYRPLWVGTSIKPKSAARIIRPRIHHRGVSLDPLVVWGADERRVYNDTSYPWGCVCRIETAGGQGSGVLVGPRHVLTASHIIDWNSGKASIEVHRAGGTAQATARAERTWSFTQVADNDSTTLDEDYAVIVTDQRLGDRFGWMGTRTYESRWDDEDYWHSVGYPSDIAGSLFPVHQRDQNLDEDEWDYGSARAMTTSADVMPGQSGSPIFGFWSDGPYVVAVVAAIGSVYASGTENWCSGGSLLTRLVNEARSNDQ